MGSDGPAGVALRLLTRLLAVAVCTSACAASPDGGRLVIVGGALAPDNGAVYRAFVEALPADAPGPVAVIAAASGGPVDSARRFGAAAARYGLPPSRTVFVRLAVADDERTDDVDEGAWRDNASDPAEVAKVRAAAGVWFTGGDQSRLTRLLIDAGGRPTPMLRAVRERLAAGAVVGGTSAGAAIMSDPMLTGGTTLATLQHMPPSTFAAVSNAPLQPLERADGGETVGMGAGLGLFQAGLVDQHFDARARLGRLAAVLGRLPPGRRVGYGVDENTALVVDLATDSARVAGQGYVTVIDGRGGRWSAQGGRLAISGLRVSLAAAGDRLDLENVALRPADWLSATVGNEYYAQPAAPGGGIAQPWSGMAHLLGRELLDNSAQEALARVSFEFDGAAGRGVRYRFRQDTAAAGFWGRDAAGVARYAIRGVLFDVEPVELTLRDVID